MFDVQFSIQLLAVKSTIDRKNAELSDLSWHYEKEVNELEHELTNAKLNNSDLKTELVFNCKLDN